MTITRNPVFLWMVENFCIVSLALLRWHCVPFAERGDNLMLMWWMLVGSLFTVEGGIVLHHFFSELVYKDTLYLNGQKSKPIELSKAIHAWCTCNLPANIVAVCTLPFLTSSDEDSYNSVIDPYVDWVQFFVKLLIIRLTVDVVFYLAHRLLHTKWLYFLHKKHHQHHDCQVAYTNSQFHFMDLIIEGFLPPLIGMKIILPLFGYSVTYFENSLVFSYIIWYETGSHCGKELPTVSYFPPLSIATRLLGLENNNIRFHENHHKYHDCNYGITQWIDFLLGSRNVTSGSKSA
eukprot:TRINITY_DN18977_c0_g1_i1.p1 TRINITY_DN18977_c0_g1~~TRINITY_DN18977_c0_g1_i1.p1  ORF type:complete len:316 (+),score=27.63 TRINITY_DN18977_c0_g1_i1:77-949(+)